VHVTCKSGHSSFVPLPASLIADADSKCVGFKATKECNPSGEADTANDKSCDTEIEDSQGGYCLCYNNRRKNFACGHNTFTCADICKVHFPEVIAQSHERLWTNQVAGNLVQTAGDWMSSITTDQWIVFDLGAKYHVKSVELKMWGSTANPKDCVLQSSDNQLGPWNDAKKFTVTAAETEDQTVALTPVEGRYFRTFFKNNYGAEWGMGLNQVSFEYTEPSPTPVPAPDRCNQYTDCSGCVYTSMLSDQENCGWCGATSTCTTGFAGKPSTGSCSADWMWTSCSTGKLWFLHKCFVANIHRPLRQATNAAYTRPAASAVLSRIAPGALRIARAKAKAARLGRSAIASMTITATTLSSSSSSLKPRTATRVSGTQPPRGRASVQAFFRSALSGLWFTLRTGRRRGSARRWVK